MKKLLVLILWLPVAAAAQQIPPDGFDRIRIEEPQQSVIAEIKPVKTLPSPDKKPFYFWYGGNLLHATQGGYSGKLLNGEYLSYYPNKAMKEEGNFKSGLKEGLWRAWDDQGNLTGRYNWASGLRSGAFEDYEKGQLKRKGNYRHDLIDGNVRVYESRGHSQTLKYDRGIITEPVHRSLWGRLNPFHRKAIKIIPES